MKEKKKKSEVSAKDPREALVDPNFSGAFVGGPPLLSREDLDKIIHDPDSLYDEALANLRKFVDAAERKSPRAKTRSAKSGAALAKSANSPS